MPQSNFRFKQFTVHQDRCAMKVGTDGVLLGAWTHVTRARHVLDVGTGTGLIALMIAQRSPAIIDAVEVEPQAASQAAENVAASPWAERITVHEMSAQQFLAGSKRRYDLIVSNPPYFDGQAQDHARTIARHRDQLTAETLLALADQHLADEGRLALIYPAANAIRVIDQAERYHFTVARRLNIKPKAHLPVNRILIEYKKGSSPLLKEDTLIIEQAERYVYTPDFIRLIRDYYLKY